MKPDVSQLSQAITRELSKDNDLFVAVLYGSSVTGNLRSDSDIDLAVLYNCTLSPEKRIALLERLNKSLPMPVDLVDLSTASGVILKEILCSGRVLIKKNPQAFIRLLERLVYNQEDVMPYYYSALRERAKRFANV